jgi:hypothetical protein
LPRGWLSTSGIRVITATSVGVGGTVILLQSAEIECGQAGDLEIRIPEEGETRYGSTIAAINARRTIKVRKVIKVGPCG